MAPARGSKAASKPVASRTLVIDNGAYTMKAGFAQGSPDLERDCHLIPNCIARSHNQTWVGSQLNQCTDFAEMAFRRPVQKGHLVNWEAEKEIWDQTFLNAGAKLHVRDLQCDPLQTNLVLADAPSGLPTLQSNCDQIVFEEYEFAAYRRYPGPVLNCYNDIAGLFGDPTRTDGKPFSPSESVLVIDSGYSHTTVTPVFNGQPIPHAVRRLDIGGKFLTNYLKEVLSIRQNDVRDETHMVNLMKEDSCFVSLDFASDLEKVRKDPLGSGIVVDYVMPDYTTRHRGEIRTHDPTARKQMAKMGSVQGANGVLEFVATLGNERFGVPELLFHPNDIGMQQAGLPEMVLQSLSAVPTGLWPAMLANIYVVGGTANFPGFMDRLYEEIRQLAPTECIVRVARATDVIKSTWLGAARLASHPSFVKYELVTREEYHEHGAHWLLRKFSR